MFFSLDCLKKIIKDHNHSLIFNKKINEQVNNKNNNPIELLYIIV